MDAGYDDIESMLEQMKSPLPLTEETFRAIGIKKPGHIVRIALKLEEDSSLTRSMKLKRRQQSIDMRCGVFGTLPSNATFGFSVTPGIKEWLAGIKLVELYAKFEESGYDDYDYLVGQMRTRKPVSNEILKDDIKIEKPGHRSRILSKLQEDLELLT